MKNSVLEVEDLDAFPERSQEKNKIYVVKMQFKLSQHIEHQKHKL